MWLEKWYGDRQGPDGIAIRYRAALGIGPFIVGYDGHLDGAARAGRRVRPWKLPLPEARSEPSGATRVTWPADGGGMIWAGAGAAASILFEDGANRVLWHPVIPAAAVSDADGRAIGAGYVERMRLDGAPWRLGLTRLLWGRFVAHEPPRASLVWIVWEGANTLSHSRLDGRDAGRASVSSDSVTVTGARLAIGAGTAIVTEAIAGGALPRLPTRWLGEAGRFLAGVESKWFAPGRLTREDGAAVDGLVIHEEVTW